MTINLQTGGYTPPQPLPGARSADVQSGYSKPSNENVTLPPQAEPASEVKQPSSDDARYEKIAAAVRKVSANIYPVSDKNFTIFKDASGQYITRYTSLRDGRVTYIPEVKMLQMFESQYTGAKAALEITA